MAQDKKITAIALTDHDSIEGLAEAEMEAKKCDVNFLKGIEISVSYGQQRLLHILGLGIDSDNAYFAKVYDRLRSVREEGLERVLWILSKQGISIKMQELSQYATGKYLDRHTLTKYFVHNNICKNVPEVWYNYLDPIAYGKGELLEADEAIDIIKKSGGLSFLAHFHKKIGLEGYTKAEVEQHIQYLVSLGLDGIEQYYPSFNKEQMEYAQYLINKYELIASGGTDFHGSNRPEIALGTGEGDFNVPDSVYDTIRSRFQK
jgi:predicted metal-dependent phosphoesterase TrpH